MVVIRVLEVSNKIDFNGRKNEYRFYFFVIIVFAVDVISVNVSVTTAACLLYGNSSDGSRVNLLVQAENGLIQWFPTQQWARTTFKDFSLSQTTT